MKGADVTLGKYLFGMLKGSKDQQTHLITVDVVERTRELCGPSERRLLILSLID